ncbi:hypothetical protein SAMN05216258_105190 [Albimonas pacifica]|uniref:Uncharacterized protein n=1 Tax=Albimonas pacifica TaxID=1114924 RepID=A0A1I3GJ69_9RHOB|nr:hypothetical protein SAMN05216258_105190 [Albimonas pacifica]
MAHDGADPSAAFGFSRPGGQEDGGRAACAC